MKKYITTQGDTWDYIAYKLYGNEIYMSELIEANLSCKEIAVFSGGDTVVIPDIDIEMPNKLPPWKRV